MNNDDDVLVRIGGKTYRLEHDKPESLRKIPWSQRKRLIVILEAIKKAEYQESSDVQKSENQQESQEHESKVSNAVTVKTSSSSQANYQASEKSHEHKFPAQDSDVLMQRFLAEQPTHKRPIPTKSSVYKWLVIIFGVIIFLVLVL